MTGRWWPRAKPGADPGVTALWEVAALFLPAIPAYLWLWPRVEGTGWWIAQCLTYVYVLAGTLFIGLRRWSLSELGINRKGLWLSLTAGLVILVGRLLIIRAVDWAGDPPRYSSLELAGLILFYIALVGLVEELLYRGLVYRALEGWLGVRWALWGSSIGFMLWHLFGQGPLVGLAALLIGLVFALVRWRAGGIVGLVFLHGAWDLQTALLVSGSNAQILDFDQLGIARPGWIFLGLFLMVSVPVYLWKKVPKG